VTKEVAESEVAKSADTRLCGNRRAPRSGALDIESQRGSGTRLTVEIPTS
jgi:hypothetical protein